MQTLLATFDDPQTAQRAVDQLIAQGFARENVHVQGSGSNRLTNTAANDTGVMSSIGHFFSNLFGSDSDSDAAAGNYAEAVRRGSSVVAVDATSDTELNQAKTLLQQLGSVDVDQRAAEWKSKGWTGFDPNSEFLSAGDEEFAQQSVPVVQEELQVGKRVINTGGLRVIKRISETPVSEMVTLRQERATIERRPVDRPATEADFTDFQEGTTEVRESSEEAVIGKRARVVEEVTVGKEVTERQETVSDTVRRTDVDVERIPGKNSISTNKKSLS